MSRNNRSLVIHPMVFALFPVLSLYAYNIGQTAFSKTNLSMILIPVVALIALILMGVISRNFRKAGIAVSAFILMFFTYGHLSDPVRIAVFILFIVAIFFLIRTRRRLIKLTRILNIAALALVIIPLIDMVRFQFYQPGQTEQSWRPQMTMPEPSGNEEKSYPDIYYIILDGYARSDILKDVYHYDNSNFLRLLEEEGFYIADSSRANYCQTTLSLASTLNLTYLNDIVKQIGVESDNREPMKELIRNSYVLEFLRQYGYEIASFASGYSMTEIQDADYYFERGFYLNEFEHMLLSQTPIPRLLRKFPLTNQWEMHRQDILYTFNKLLDLPETEAPLFTLAHIIAPHPPFVFDERGGPIDYDRNFDFSDGSHYLRRKGASPGEYLHNYRGQVNFISNMVLAMVRKIKIKTRYKAAIILQADHGPGSLLFWERPDITYFKERLSIFNAYYLPDGDTELLYEKITPVNTFRVLFNHYFNTDFALLEDRSYFSTWEKPYIFIDVTEQLDMDTGNRPRFKGLH